MSSHLYSSEMYQWLLKNNHGIRPKHKLLKEMVKYFSLTLRIYTTKSDYDSIQDSLIWLKKNYDIINRHMKDINVLKITYDNLGIQETFTLKSMDLIKSEEFIHTDFYEKDDEAIGIDFFLQLPDKDIEFF